MQSIKKSCENAWRYRYLLVNLIAKDFKLKYRRSILGVAWSVLNPLLTCLVMYVVFGSLMKGLSGSGIPNFAAFLLIGQLLYNFFRESTSMAMESILGNASLLRKVYIPKYIFPLEKICFGTVNCLFSFIALVLVLLFTWTPVSWSTLLLAVYPLFTMFFFNLGVGLLLSALYVFVRDIKHIWDVFCTLLVYGSAIFYDPSMMAGWVQWVIKFNPLYHYITAFRECVMWGIGLDPSRALICLVSAVASMALGICVFSKTQDKFVLYI